MMTETELSHPRSKVLGRPIFHTADDWKGVLAVEELVCAGPGVGPLTALEFRRSCSCSFSLLIFRGSQSFPVDWEEGDYFTLKRSLSPR